jgi:hypothetical protein
VHSWTTDWDGSAEADEVALSLAPVCGDLRVFVSELVTELTWAAHRPTSEATVNNRFAEAILLPVELGPEPHVRSTESAFLIACTEVERDHIRDFRRLVPGAVLDIQRTPDDSAGSAITMINDDVWSPLSLMSNMHLQFCDMNVQMGLPMGRWLTATEALLAQGFRVRADVRRPYLQSSFEGRLTGRTTQAVREAAGSCSSIPCLGVMIAHSAINIEIAPDQTCGLISARDMDELTSLKATLSGSAHL